MRAALLPILILTTTTLQAQRVVLVEMFTQAGCPGCPAQDARIAGFLAANPDKAVAINYHTSFPGADPMNTDNPTDVADRVLYYGISTLPQSALEGRKIQPVLWNADSITARAARATPFRLRAVHRVKSENGLDTLIVTVTVRKTATAPAGTLLLHTAIVERNMHFSNPPGSNGQQDFDWVMKKMLPTPAGKTLPAIAVGDSVRYTYKWRMQNVFDLSKVNAVVFVQNSATKQVYQAAQSVSAAPFAFALQTPGGSTKVLAAGDTGRFSFNLTTGSSSPVPFRVKLVPDAAGTQGLSGTISDGRGHQGQDSLEVEASNSQPANLTITVPVSTHGVRYKAMVQARPQPDSLRYLFQQSPVHIWGKARTLVVNLETGSGQILLQAMSQRPTFDMNGDEFADFDLGLMDTASYRNVVFNTGSQYARAMSAAQMFALQGFILSGGNVAVIGQSFGLVTRQPLTTYLRPFLNDYLGAEYDVPGSQFLSIYGEPTDFVFSRFTTQNLAQQPGQTGFPDMYNLYAANPTARVAFRYSNLRIAGTYCEGISPVGKTVFLGFGAEQVQIAAIRRQIMNRIIDYFDGLVEVGIQDRVLIQPLTLYPNPACRQVHVQGSFKPNQVLVVRDLAGRCIISHRIESREDILLNTGALRPGLYPVNLMEDGRTIGQERLSIQK